MDGIILVISIFFWFIVILIPLVIIHEFGHFLMAKLVGVKVVEYGIGIPPRIFSKKWKGVIWSLNWLPIGGFAKIFGDHDALDSAEDYAQSDPSKARSVYTDTRVSEILASGDLQYFLEDNNLEYSDDWKKLEKNPNLLTDENEKDLQALYKQLQTLIDWEYDSVISTKQAFCNVSWWRQTVILLGGITFNLITAIILFFVLFSFVSTPRVAILPDDLAKIEETAEITERSENVKILNVIEGTAAEESGLQRGDDLLSFDGIQLVDVQNFDEFAEIIQNQDDAQVSITYRDDDTGEIVDKVVNLQEEDGKFYFGLRSTDIGYLVRFRSRTPVEGFQRALSTTSNIFVLNFRVLGQVVTALLPTTEDRSALQQVGGPVAIGSVGSDIFDLQGVAGIINVMAIISVALAVFNILPIPALDGGRFVIITINRILGKRNKRIEAFAISITFVLMLALAVVVAVSDVIKISSGQSLL